MSSSHSMIAVILMLCTTCGRGVADETTPPQFLRKWGGDGDRLGEFHFPIGIAINSSDEIHVTDHYNNRVQKFDTDGKLLDVFETLPNPGGITIDAKGRIYVSHFPASSRRKEKSPDRISVYDPRGKLLKEWGKSGSGDGEFSWPGGLAISKSERIYVADQTNRRIQYFDLNGKFLGKWGSYGTEPGQFGGNVSENSRVGGPQFLAIDTEGNVFTTEASMGRIQKFTADGTFLASWGDNKDQPGSFGRNFDETRLVGPIGICLSKQRTLWITSAGGRIQEFTPSGKFLRGIGEVAGVAPGRFLAPHGISMSSQGDLFIVDSYNQRIQKFGEK